MLNPPRDRPNPSRSGRTADSIGSVGSGVDSVAGFVWFDPAPCVIHRVGHDRRWRHVRRFADRVELQQRRQPSRRNVLGRLMARSRSVLMRADHGRIHPDRPLPTVVTVASRPQPLQDLFPRAIT